MKQPIIVPLDLNADPGSDLCKFNMFFWGEILLYSTCCILFWKAACLKSLCQFLMRDVVDNPGTGLESWKMRSQV